MQPYGLLVAFLLFFCLRVKFSFSQLCLFFLFIFSFFLLLISGVNFTSLRSFFNYASLFFISYISFYVLKSERFNIQTLLKISILIWFFVGFLQSIYRKDFLTFLVSSSRTTENRGVTGLAPEPTFYGIVLIFFILFLLHMDFRFKRYYILLCVFGIVFLAKSSMAVLFLVIMIFYYILTHASVKYLLFSLILIFSTPFLFFQWFEGTRLSFLLTNVVEDPAGLLLVDASLNDRFFHVFFSMKGFFDNFFLPNGFLNWNQYVLTQIPIYSNWVIVEWFSVGGRIMSGYGGAFYELGLCALLIPVVLFFELFSIYRNDVKKFLFFFFYINTIMFSAIPIGFSFFAFYIGFLGYVKYRSRLGV
ncbi:hypothetical protein CYL31_04010 [Marinomonas sp. A3A]|uniref:hypothetical protein n=1 Tax=Marinomonas sp. A3A TaxID=2065312 RepID=UPI001BB3FE58|nr:hypothetical protein [Marinomonas sp. A3A]QUX90617.1 hypothetical protein CYL31_04010 [Marinomonas sp. A3A]